MSDHTFHIFSPYRVCPIGAHVDHQHGLVTGFAIDKGIDLWFSPVEDGKTNILSRNFEGEVCFSVQEPTLRRQGNWGDYARGAVYALKKRFEIQCGIDGIIQGSLPIGGLSSSAAILVAYVMAFASANHIVLTPMEVVRTASEAEREYIGLNNGILDQACIVLGRKNHLLMLDCDSNDYRLISKPDTMPAFKLGIFFSGLTRSLVNSDYNLRVSECKVAAWNMLAYEGMELKTMDRTFLRDIPYKTFEKYREAMPARFVRRAEHFYGEYKRVREAVTAWEAGNIDWFGNLSYQSCESSIHCYECGSPELIALYEAMRNTQGIYGGRFSGAGFKGACIALCDPDKTEAIAEQVREQYLSRFPQYADTFQSVFCDTHDGARFVTD
ncbi:MAG: galactokinase family protein [Paludibacteraceae bacterium]|nr:galactokinase family protein [Paludibacteraceae bacterium]